MKNLILISILFCGAPFCYAKSFCNEGMFICTAADENHFPWLLNLIGSLHKVNFEDITAIAVFDLGFTQKQRTQLNKIAKVSVHDVEIINPDLLTFFKTRGDCDKRTYPNGPYVRGYYAWKPVVLKQALGMFPYVLYIDSGITVTGSLKRFFAHIRRRGYCFTSCNHSIKQMATKRVIQKFKLNSPQRNYILHEQTQGICGGFQGVSRAVYKKYIVPVYNLAHDLKLFKDDGTCPQGFGWGRHDQALFSVYVNLLKLKSSPLRRVEKYVAFSRGNINLLHMKRYIRYKKR